MQPVVDLRMVGKVVRVHCPDAPFEAWMRSLYRTMEPRAAGASTPDLEYRVATSPDGPGRGRRRRRGESGPAGGGGQTRFRLVDGGETVASAATAGEILVQLEDTLTIALQLQRSDLLFVHAGVVAADAGAVVLVGPSGAGKSTLTWALTRRGLAYLSDELAPFDPGAVEVVPFPRAIHLKNVPPGIAALPADTVDTGPSLCVPAESLAGGVADTPSPLRSLLFLAASPRPPVPAIQEISGGDAVSRLFANTLNALAHPAYGVDAAVSIVRQARCYELAASGLEATCELIYSTLDLAAGPVTGD